jgi:iron(III) transport system ATP-binding protein
MDPMLSVSLSNITKRFGEVVAVDRISLDIEPGEFFFLLGPSGCGKTTLLRMLAGFLDPDAGEIRFGDKPVTSVPAHRRNTGMVFQNYALWPHMTVFENVAYGLELRKVASQDRKRRVNDTLSLVQMNGLEKRKPNELSGGQQQRVALARALVIEPDVLLLDEPLSNLDAKLRVEMRNELRRIHAQTGITTIYVTHDQKEALSLARRIAVMESGRVRQVGTPREIYVSPADQFVAEFVGQANILHGQAESADGTAIVRTPYGNIRAQTTLSGNVSCCIRPEALRLGAGANGGNRLRGTVTDVTYLGDQEQIVLRLSAPGAAEEEINLLVHHPKSAVATPGETVEVSFSPDDVIVVQN